MFVIMASMLFCGYNAAYCELWQVLKKSCTISKL